MWQGQKYTTMYFSLLQGQPTVAINQIISTKALYNPFKNASPELDAKIEAVRNGNADAEASWPRKSTSTWWSRPGSRRCSASTRCITTTPR